MAKRKSSKKSGVKAILDFVVLALAGGMFGFLALPFVKAQASGLGETRELARYNGYQLMDFENNAGVATCVLLMIIFASLLAVFAIVKMLADIGTLKGATLSKVVAFGTVVLALAVLVMTIVLMIVIPTNCKVNGAFGFSGGTTAVWYGLIINACAGLATFVTSVFSIRK